ncbi:sterile alpha motif domain-containing protein 7 [Limosa lapponica baueri]|uniref:Sterile alpha motif domain-containing protein 7 n=1 Tax=Limosa lapponica baueri TaxID=1758121 RepID=A0A2I0TJN0_LIMLA|nr:sterile alpha motif domain-containing protein 7 [Limosa lapponica baueri]
MLMRNQLMAVNPQLMGAGQQRMQAIPSQFEPRLVDRDLLPSTEMMASADPRQIHIASHLGPAVPQHPNMPNLLSNRVYPGPGLRKNCATHEISAETNSCSNTNEKESNSSCAAFDDKYMYPSAIPFSALPYGFPVPSNPLLPSGAHGLILNGEDMSSIEDIRKWTVDDVYNFISSLPGCSDYAQIFKDHAIDGETLPLLTEEHLLDTMGLKLGPALKIRSQVSRRLGNVFYMMNLPLSMPLPPPPGKPSDQPSDIASPLHCNSSGDTLDSPCSQDPETSKAVEQIVSESRENPCDTAGSQADFQMITFQKS